VRTAIGQFVHKSRGELSLQLLQLADFAFGLEYLLVMVCIILSTLVWFSILGERRVSLCLDI
jgi:hypothetical protein